jgi:tetratricopeptide (TPR) repeat protein
MRHFVLCLLVPFILAGCATTRPPAPVTQVAPTGSPLAVEAQGDQAGPDLSSFIEQLRGRSVHARPKASGTGTAEQRSPALAEAVASAQAFPSVENNLRAAEAYGEAGIPDQAYDYFARAARLDPQNAAAWDGMARIWRDWGFAGLGLPDAYRAVSFAPDSPVPQNTLGTILQTLGHGSEARARFGKALELDHGAAYALNNLCYSWLMDARTSDATRACRVALALTPGSIVARHNLGLARAAAGDTAGAASEFEADGPASAQYNMGIVYLAERRFSAAARAFERAAALRPGFAQAARRADAARKLAGDAGSPGEPDERR